VPNRSLASPLLISPTTSITATAGPVRGPETYDAPTLLVAATLFAPELKAFDKPAAPTTISSRQANTGSAQPRSTPPSAPPSAHAADREDAGEPDGEEGGGRFTAMRQVCTRSMRKR